MSDARPTTCHPSATVRLMPVVEFLEIWPSAPKLSPEEAASYAADLRRDRETLGLLDNSSA